MNFLVELWYRLTRQQRILVLLAALVLVGGLAFLVSRRMVTEEEKVKAAVLEAVGAVEAQSIQRVMEIFSKNYRGYYYSSYGELIPAVGMDFNLYSTLSVSVTQWNVAIEGNEATVDMRFRFRMMLDQAGPYRNFPMTRLPSTPPGEDEQARLVLRKEEGMWRIVELDVKIPAH
jgi:hypothetical protein